jgi:hypothetical protein
MVENRMLGRIFEPRRVEVMAGWGKLYSEGEEIGRACSANEGGEKLV